MTIRAVRCRYCNMPTGEFFDTSEGGPPNTIHEECTGPEGSGIPYMAPERPEPELSPDTPLTERPLIEQVFRDEAEQVRNQRPRPLRFTGAQEQQDRQQAQLMQACSENGGCPECGSGRMDTYTDDASIGWCPDCGQWEPYSSDCAEALRNDIGATGGRHNVDAVCPECGDEYLLPVNIGCWLPSNVRARISADG